MNWRLSDRADPVAKRIADRHYNRQNPDAAQFVPPGRCLVLVSRDSDALWITSYPFPEFVQHAWAGAWVCSVFRNEGPLLSSDLIREAVAVTRSMWPTPELGMITFVDRSKVRRKRDPGRCFRRAGFRDAICSAHMIFPTASYCAACNSKTKGGLIALQLLPSEMPEMELPVGTQYELLAAGAAIAFQPLKPKETKNE